MMDSNRFGKKHTCKKCKAKFYDMNKAPPVCPKCGSNKTKEARYREPIVVTDDELDADVGSVYDDDKSLPGDLDLEVDGLDGDYLMLPVATGDFGDDVFDDVADDA